MLTAEQVLIQSGARQTGNLAREVAWGCKVAHWGPRDWRDLWRALRVVPVGRRLYLWARLLGIIAADRRRPISALLDED